MKLIVGLGNPGKKYENTRHNVGFMVLDQIASNQEISNWVFKKRYEAVIATNGLNTLAKPQTFMNRSGIAVKKLMLEYKIPPENLYIIHDDLDLALGSYKIHYIKGPNKHGGIDSIEQKIKTDKFWRIRIGVDNRKPESRVEGETYVLNKFQDEERVVITKVIREVTDKIIEKIYD